MIFYYDEGNIKDYTFTSFDKFEGSKGMREVAEFLDEHNTDVSDFTKAVKALESYCREMEKKCNKKCWLFGGSTGSGSVLLGVLGYLTNFAAFRVAGLVVGGIGVGVVYYYYHKSVFYGY